MIGIIAAMQIEADGIIDLMENKEAQTISSIVYTSGTLGGKDVVVAVSSEGKVNAAMCVQTMILRYNATAVINTGVAGGMSDKLGVCDVVVATKVCEHDMDMSPLGFERGYISGVDSVYMDCDKKMCDTFEKCLNKIGVKWHSGVIATGDQFITPDMMPEIRERCNAIACEMEGGAIGHVCVRNGVPFAVLRAISDGVNDGLTFEEFANLAAKNSINATVEFVKEY